MERMADPDAQRNEGIAADAGQVHGQEGHENQHLHLSESEKGLKWK